MCLLRIGYVIIINFSLTDSIVCKCPNGVVYIPILTIKQCDTPLHGAARNGHLSVVKYLVEHGANVGAKDVVCHYSIVYYFC
jgi:hypothetical protein